MAPDAQSTASVELTVNAAATILGVSRHTVYRLIHEGILGYRRAGLPTSRRPTYRVIAEDVYGIRQRHERNKSGRSAGRGRKAAKHVTTHDLEFIRLK